MRAIVQHLTAATLIAALAAPAAGADCRCRAKGVVATLGQTVCLSLPSGERLARCDKVLNNTSWVILPGSCSRAT